MDAAAPVVDRVSDMLLASMDACVIVLGDRLGCWSAIAEAGEAGVDAGGLASACDFHERYAHEWLEAMGSAGLLNVAVTEGGTHRFSLAPGVREVLVDPESPSYLTPFLRQAVSAAAALRALERAYRGGHGVGWSEHDADMRDAQGDANRLQLRDFTGAWVREHLPRAAARLDAGGRAADVGCGYGWASIGLARSFPAAAVDAFDVDAPSIEMTTRNVTDHGLADRVSAHLSGIDAATPGTYDLAILAEMLHDVPDPIGVLSATRRALAPGGVALVADMKVADEYAVPGDPLERIMYGYSLLVCLPDSMASQPTAATGTVMRPRTLQAYATAAGMRTVELDIEHDGWRFWALTAEE